MLVGLGSAIVLEMASKMHTGTSLVNIQLNTFLVKFCGKSCTLISRTKSRGRMSLTKEYKFGAVEKT